MDNWLNYYSHNGNLASEEHILLQTVTYIKGIQLGLIETFLKGQVPLLIFYKFFSHTHVSHDKV